MTCRHHHAPCSCIGSVPAERPLSELSRRRFLESGAVVMVAGAIAAAGAPWPARAQAQTASGRTLIKGGHVVSMDRGIGDLARGDVLIEGSKIAAIQPDIAADGATVIDAGNMIVMPGFIDTHRHMWQAALRNVQPDATLADYFRVILNKYALVYRPEDVYAGNLLTALGALDAGVTTVLDWSHIQNTPEHTDAAVKGLQDAGARTVFGYGSPQKGKPYFQDQTHGFPDDIARIRKQFFNSDDQLLTLALAGSVPGIPPVEVVKREWKAARAVGARISVHAGTRGPGGIEALGRDMLGPDVTYIHCTKIGDSEWKMIADSGGTVSIAALVEMQMGHGDPPFQKALDAGIRPSLSVDVETSIPSDMFTQMRVSHAVQRQAIHKRLAAGEKDTPKLVTARDVVEFATVEGARANGLDKKCGSLSVGKDADVVLLSKDRINVMPVNDPYGAIVSGMDTGNVDTVFVAGKAVKRAGKLLGVDMKRVADLVAKSHEYLIAKAG
jgi:cytosine/adenosine deaminase-related metal-dependent hydrolase